MGLKKFKHDFNNDLDFFIKIYNDDDFEITGYQDYIDYYDKEDVITIDLTNKCIVSATNFCCDTKNELKFPYIPLTIFSDDGDKYGYKATLIYAGHIAFLKLDYTNGKTLWFYKDDECYPTTIQECIEDTDVAHFWDCARHNGFTDEEIIGYTEALYKTNIDYNFKLPTDLNNVIILQGL